MNIGVLFDLDGVIVDTKAAHLASFTQLGEEEGYVMTPEIFKGIFGRHNSDIFPILYGHALPAERVDWLSDRKEAIFRDTIRGRITALPGVADLLPALQAAGIPMAIGTSTPRANVDMILGDLDFTGYFTGIVSAENVTKGKPDPQVFLLAAEVVHRPPARCVVVEDAVAGVHAALAGGMKALAVTTNHTRAALHEATRIVDSLAEVGPEDFVAMVAG